MNVSWVGFAAGLVLEFGRELIADLRRTGAEVTLDQVARHIADAVMAMPFDRLPAAEHAEAHEQMATSLIATVAKVAGLSAKTTRRLHDRVGRKLVRQAAGRLEDELENLAEKQAKWKRLLK